MALYAATLAAFFKFCSLPKTHGSPTRPSRCLGDATGLVMGSEGAVCRSFDCGDRVTTNKIDASNISRLVVAYGYAAGIAAAQGANQLGSHYLRRTGARNAYENGASLLLVQTMLGHEDPKTTAQYSGAFDSDDDTAVDYVRY